MNMIIDLPKKTLAKVSTLEVGTIGDSSKAKRDNLKMLMMRSIMSNKESTKAFLNPGGYDTLVKNNVDIIVPKRTDITAKVVTDEESGRKSIVDNINPIDPSTQAVVAHRMLEGKALIGIFANAVKAHIFFQKAPELKLNKGFRFDGVHHNKLNNTKSAKGNSISRNTAEPLAGSVDNGKDPQLGYSNINGYTVDVAVGMLLAGVDLLTIQAFLAQPEIIAYANFYYQNGGTLQAERKAEKVFNIAESVRFGEYTPKNFDTDQLVSHLGSKSFNKEVLNAFIIYKQIANPINNLVLAIKVGESGLGPTDSHNIAKLDQLNGNQFKEINR